MREYNKPIIYTEEEYNENQMLQWLADSHYWVNEHLTYYCKWCGRVTTTSLQGDAVLCLKNPIILDL